MFDKIITTNSTKTISDNLVIDLLEEILARLEDIEKKNDKSKEFCGCGKQIK